MGDQNTPPQGQDPASVTPLQESVQGQVPASTPSDSAPSSKLTPDQLEAALKEVRDEAAKTRVKNKTLEEQLASLKKAQEDAKLTEAERTQKQIEELTHRAKTHEDAVKAEKFNNALLRTLVGQPLQDGVTDAMILAVLDKGAIEYDGAGTPTNLDKVVRAALKERPYLLKTTPPPGTTAPTTSPMNGAKQGTLSDEEFSAQMAALSPEERMKYAAEARKRLFSQVKS